MIRARHENGTLRLLGNRLPDLGDGEIVAVQIERGRSDASHRHQFAWLHDAWLTLPEHHRGQPWAETPETMRKHALIAKGFNVSVVMDCGSNAAALRLKVQVLPAFVGAHGYAVAQVRGPMLTVWAAESQSLRAMGKERFQSSKTALMDWVAEKLGVPVGELAA